MAVKRGERGNAVLEFAVGAGLFVALFTGTFQFGYTFYVYNNLVTAVRSAARYGSITVYDQTGATANSSPSSNFVNAVRNVAVYGNPNGGGDNAHAAAPGLTPANVFVDMVFKDGGPSRVVVTVRNYQIQALFGTWTANGKPSASFVYTGRYAPPAPGTFK